MMRIRTTQITWDDAAYYESDPDDLPQFVVLDVDHIDEVADRLSDIYGWCVESFTYEPVHPLVQLAECANEEDT